MFRMQLWSALLQTWEESFRYPGTLETTQRVKEMSWHNWQCYNYDKYNLDKNDLPPGKLLLYPIQVNPPKLLELTSLILYILLHMFSTFSCQVSSFRSVTMVRCPTLICSRASLTIPIPQRWWAARVGFPSLTKWQHDQVLCNVCIFIIYIVFGMCG